MRKELLILTIVMLILISILTAFISWRYLKICEEILPESHGLSSVKVSILYASIVDQARSIEEINIIIRDLNADLIFRGFFRWRGMASIEYKYPVYDILSEAITKIKSENPDIIIVGAVAAQEINKIEYNPYIKEVIPEDEVWGMALDPQKYGI